MIRKVLMVILLLACGIALRASEGDDSLLQQLREQAAREHWTFTVADNPAAHRPLSQLAGLKVPPGWRGMAPFRALPKLAQLPSSFDWRTLGGVSSVKDQGQCGSCWAFSTIGTFEAMVLLKTGHEYDFSEQALMSCNTQGWGCNGGFFAFDDLTRPGAVMESCMPYQGSDDVSCDLSCDHGFRLQSWYYVDPYVEIPSPEEIKTAIYLYGPLSVSIAVDGPFEYYSGGVFTGTYDQINHAVVLVGWDDSLGDQGAWIMKNSWGTGWGVEGGFMYIAYGANMVGYAAAYAVFEENPINCLTPESAWAMGPIAGAAVKDNILFHGSGAMIRALDLTTPSSPRLIGSLALPATVKGLTLSGNLLYAADDIGGVCVVDVSNPASPVLVSRLGLPRKSLAVALNGSTLCVGGNEGLHLVDVTDPHAPVERGSVPGYDSATSLRVQGHLLYAADGSSGLGIVDISDPANPVELSKTSLNIYVSAVDVSGSNAYLACWGGGIIVMDVSNPAAPVQKGQVILSGSAYDVALSGSYAYVAGYSGGLRVVDVSNPAAPVEAAHLDLGGNGDSITFAGTRVYLPGSSTGLAIADISNPKSPTLLAHLDAAGTTVHVSADGAGHLFLSQRDRGVVTLVSDGHGGWTEMGGWAGAGRALKTWPVAGGLLLTADDTGGLVVLNVGDPAHPAPVGSIALDGHALAVTASGTLAYVTDDVCGLEIVDFSNPAAPVVRGKACDPATGSGVAVQGGMAYVADGDDGLRVFDVTNPASPLQVGQVAIPGQAQAVVVQDSYAYVAAGQMGMQIVDVSDPGRPVLAGGDGGPSSGNDVAVAGRLLFLADGNSGVRMYDVSDVTNPIHVGYADTPKNAMALALAGQTLYVADSTLGMQVMAVSDCLQASAPAADFSFTPAAPVAGQTVVFTDHSSNAPATWLWNFGDGSTSDQQNPAHVYYYPGSFNVTLTVSNADGSGSKTTALAASAAGTPPPIGASGAYTYLIPAAAKTTGAENLNWVTDVVIENPGAASAAPNLYYLESGADNSAAAALQAVVPAGASVKFRDIVGIAFQKTSSAGALLIGSASPLRISSRTYNMQAAGTYGQFIPALPASDLLGQNDTAALVQLSSTSDFRTNFGWASAAAVPTDVLIRLFREDGTPIGAVTYTLPPYGQLQITHLIETFVVQSIDNLYALVSSATPQCRYAAYASVIDNHSGDPLCVRAAKVLPVDAPGAFAFFISAAAKAAGVNNTNWMTDLVLFNPYAVPSHAAVALLPADQDNSNASAVELTVPPATSMKLPDIIGKVFSLEQASGALMINADLPLIITSRTYNNQGAAGTYGQFIPAEAASEAVASGQTAGVIQLEQDAQYRANMGLVNATAAPLHVQATVRAGDGSTIGTEDYNLRPFEQTQTSAIIAAVGGSNVADAYVTLVSDTAGGSFFGYASVVDNTTGDAIFIPAMK